MLRLTAFASSLICTFGHGQLVKPVSRAMRLADPKLVDGTSYADSCAANSCSWYTEKAFIPGGTTNCSPKLRTMGVTCNASSPPDWTCAPNRASPWCAPGTAPVKSPCGIYSGGIVAGGANGRDMRDLDDTPVAKWAAGAEAEVRISLTANHGGQYSVSRSGSCFASPFFT